ncbi:MAG TPA: hypothetical protein VFV87_07255 [Pirellulaceae bacterium]|nr:hypothetical protein [Pirellulaceae bacterium]
MSSSDILLRRRAYRQASGENEQEPWRTRQSGWEEDPQQALFPRLADNGRAPLAALDLIVELRAALWAAASFELVYKLRPGARFHAGTFIFARQEGDLPS